MRGRETKNWLYYNGPEKQSEVEYLQCAHEGKIKKDRKIFLAWGEKKNLLIGACAPRNRNNIQS